MSHAEAPAFQPAGQSKCHVRKSQSKPLIVEWPAADRADLESLVRAGPVAVQYDGCELVLLKACRVPATYEYTGVTPKRDNVSIRTDDDLWATLPIGAAKMEGKLQQSGQLNVDMLLVGSYRMDRDWLNLGELQGACHGATHVVGAITIGAFEFYAGGQARVGGGVGAFGAEAGASSGASHELLSSDGRRDACDRATVDDAKPPEGCSAILRIEMVPLAGVNPSGPVGAREPHAAKVQEPKEEPPSSDDGKIDHGTGSWDTLGY
jgi:hypothetical protein